MDLSILHRERNEYMPRTPACLAGDFSNIRIESSGNGKADIPDSAALKKIFPLTFGQPLLSVVEGRGELRRDRMKAGVVFSGGPAPGGHNVILGLQAGLKRLNPANELIGFLRGPSGIIEGKSMIIPDNAASRFMNTGGFDMIQSGRTKIESEAQFASSLENCRKLGLQALAIVGGDDSNTNAAMLSEYFKAKGAGIQVIGIPKTIDGDLKNGHIEASFGFDTACRVYSELTGNICRDACSSAKYWHFIKLMGRSASHITLEVALATHVNAALIGEEILKKSQTLSDLVEQLCGIISRRAEANRNYGVVLVAEGLIEFVPEMGRLIASLNEILAGKSNFGQMVPDQQLAFAEAGLPPDQFKLFASLPAAIQRQLLAERDPHGNVQVSLIETEQLLSEMVRKRLGVLKEKGEYKGKFSPQHHFFGYEGRCAMPSNFDSNYTYGLGLTASVLMAGGVSGYMAVLKDLCKDSSRWRPAGIPLVSMMNMERRKGKDVAVIRKAMVDLSGRAFAAFARERERWAAEDAYVYPGPMQYEVSVQACKHLPESLRLELA